MTVQRAQSNIIFIHFRIFLCSWRATVPIHGDGTTDTHLLSLSTSQFVTIPRYLFPSSNVLDTVLPTSDRSRYPYIAADRALLPAADDLIACTRAGTQFRAQLGLDSHAPDGDENE